MGHDKLVMQREVLGNKVSRRAQVKQYETTDQFEHACKRQTFAVLVNNLNALYSKEYGALAR